MKKLIPILFLSLLVLIPINVDALVVDNNNLTIEKGSNETINLYAEVSEEVKEVDFTLVYTTYDIPAYFNLEAGLTDQNPNGIRHKIIFSEPVTGKIKLGTIRVSVVNNPKDIVGDINIHTANAITTNDETISLTAQTINVKVGTEEEDNNQVTNNNDDDTPKQEEKLNLLEKIESEIVNIDIKEDVYEYTVNIKSEVKELDLKPIAKDDKYEVEITTQKIDELEDNKIIITVKDGNEKEEYTIKVNIIDIEDVEIDNEEFESTYKYKGKWIILIIILLVVLFIGVMLIKKK